MKRWKLCVQEVDKTDLQDNSWNVSNAATRRLAIGFNLASKPLKQIPKSCNLFPKFLTRVLPFWVSLIIPLNYILPLPSSSLTKLHLSSSEGNQSFITQRLKTLFALLLLCPLSQWQPFISHTPERCLGVCVWGRETEREPGCYLTRAGPR